MTTPRRTGHLGSLGAGRGIGRVLRGLLALVILTALVAGVPLVLVSLIGNPVPTDWTWTGTLTSSALLGVLACIAWLFWGQLVVCVVVEILAEIRVATGRSGAWMERIPGTFGGQQALARTLVQAVVAIGAASAVVGSGTLWLDHTASAEAATPAPVAAPVATSASQPPGAALTSAPKPTHIETTTVTVERGDTLWSIAENRLGSGERWRDIAHLNHGREMTDGTRFDSARNILPGWSLLVPVHAGPTEHTTTAEVTVKGGDTLWSLAEQEYHDGTAWPRIYHANESVIEDPHWIQPGQHLAIPSAHQAHNPTANGHSTESGVSANPSESPTGQPTTTPPDTSQGPPSGAPEDSARGHEEPRQGSRATSATHRGGASETDDLHIDHATLERALLSGGGFLAAGTLVLYLERRRTQSRNRPSGRIMRRLAPHLRTEEKALRRIGGAALAPSTFLDLSLRELGRTSLDDGWALPNVLAARICAESLELRLVSPAHDAPEPWQVSPDGLMWSLSRDRAPSESVRPSPYLALVTIGEDTDGATWLVDLEAAGVVQITGDTDVGADLVRFIAAELAINPWSDSEEVTVVGIADDVVPLNQGRLFAEPALEAERLIKTAHKVTETMQAGSSSVLAARISGASDGPAPDITLAALSAHQAALVAPLVAEFLDVHAASAGRVAVALVALAAEPVTQRALTLTATPAGEIETPWGPLKVNRLTPSDATTIGQLFDDADHDEHEPIPTMLDSLGIPMHADQAGALTEALTRARSATGEPDSLLPRPDPVYLESAATTPEDLAALAPASTAPALETIHTKDRDLDADLAAWDDPSTTRPKLRVLGPVELRAVGERTKEVETRPAYYAELTAYLACHPNGVTPGRVAADFGIQNNTLHTRLGQLRKWLGQSTVHHSEHQNDHEDNRHDGGQDGTHEHWYLPPAQWIRGQKMYELNGVLRDADLFRRLRARGEARGPEGIEDLRRALELVQGPPYDQQRPGGYDWLVDAPDDQYLVAGIVDVAHIVATHALAEHDEDLAMWAAEKAILAAPSEDKPRLDWARAVRAGGEAPERKDLLQNLVIARTDDDRPPPEPSERTSRVLERFDG